MSETEQTTVEATEPPTQEPPAEMAPSDWESKYADLKKAYDDLGGDDATKWRQLSRKNEAEAKRLHEAQMSDTEKAVADAEARGRAEARREAAQAVAQARLEAALSGVVPADKAADLISDVNIGAYVTEDGDVDAEKVAAFRERYAALVPAKQPAPDLAQGVRRKDEPGQLSLNDLRTMTPEAIVEAKEAGRLADLLGSSN